SSREEAMLIRTKQQRIVLLFQSQRKHVLQQWQRRFYLHLAERLQLLVWLRLGLLERLRQQRLLAEVEHSLVYLRHRNAQRGDDEHIVGAWAGFAVLEVMD